MLSPWFPWGLESPNSRSFRKSLLTRQLVVQVFINSPEGRLALSHSKRQRPHSEDRVYPILLRFHPLPSGMLSTSHDRS